MGKTPATNDTDPSKRIKKKKSLCERGGSSLNNSRTLPFKGEKTNKGKKRHCEEDDAKKKNRFWLG